MDFTSSIFICLFTLIASPFVFPGLGKIRRRLTKQFLRSEHKSGISLLASIDAETGIPVPGPMVSAKELPHVLTEDAKENYLTPREVVAIVQQYTTIPYAGEYEDRWTIKTLQEEFADTVYGRMLHSLPQGESITGEMLFRELEEATHIKRSDRRVSVNEGIFRYGRRDGQEYRPHEHLEWEQRASAYRVAMLRLVPDLPVSEEGLANISVEFETITPANQMQLWQIIDHWQPDIFDPTGEHVLFMRINQLRFFHCDTESQWHEKAPLIYIQTNEARTDDTMPYSASAFFKRAPIPASFFDPAKLIDPDVQDAETGITAPMPPDLQIPEG